MKSSEACYDRACDHLLIMTEIFLVIKGVQHLSYLSLIFRKMKCSIVELILFISVNVVSSATVRVKTDNGDVEGTVAKSLFAKRNFYSFKGIPYAKPPVGELRFKVNFNKPLKLSVTCVID